MKLLHRVMLLAVFILLGGIASRQSVNAAPLPQNETRPTSFSSLPNAQGCSGTPTIQYAYANPPVIYPGQVTTLYWGLVGNANAAYLQYPDGHRQGIGTPGAQQVNPTQTTTYFVIGVCGGNQAQFPITVTVQGGPTCSGTPQITSFTANPTTINSGQPTTVAWGPVNNADNVQLSSTTQGGSGVPTPGSVVVYPTQTTTYYLTAWCQGNSTQQQVTVTVNNPPPPPPPNENRITGIQFNGGLSNATTLVVTVNYFWNGQDAPAVLQATAFSANGQPIAHSNATRIDANRQFYANLNFKVNPKQVQRVNVCMIGSSGTDLVCQNGPK